MLYPLYISKTEDFFFTNLLETLVLNFINFYVIYFSLPVLLGYKNKLKSVALGVVLILLLSVFKYYAELYFWKYLMHSPPKVMEWVPYWFSNNLRLSIVYSIYALLIKLAIDWYESQKFKAELILQKQASELALLRSQVNPHFLFNTLNNIYSLVYQKSDDAPAAVMKLSGIMRYMLYDAVADKVLLEKEVEYLQSFIELQNLRLKQKDFVVMNIQGEMIGRTIAPMLLIPFVENAFKHGSRNVTNPGILINLFVDSRQIHFEVTNYMRKNVLEPQDGSGGNGLTNTKLRLELVYPGKHHLFIIPGDEMYTVKLTIQDQK
ncbi:MAG TPA: histidine kinase [Bacteroidales bacterium]|jgi:two-component system, LytTR family, sensor kinase